MHRKVLGVENVPTNEISLREAASSGAMGNGQGFIKCGCTKGCQSDLATATKTMLNGIANAIQKFQLAITKLNDLFAKI